MKIVNTLIITFVSAYVLLVLRGIIFKLLYKWAAKTKTKLDDTYRDTVPSPYSLSQGGKRMAEIREPVHLMMVPQAVFFGL